MTARCGPAYPYLGPTYNPASTSPSSIAKRVLVVACVGVGVLFMAAILAAVAIPTFLSVKAASAGTGWFNGGVPGWPTVTVPGMNSTSSGAVVETWEVQGADFSGPGPYMAVVRLSRQLPVGETAGQYLSNVAEQLESDGDDADLTALTNGSPAVQWTKVDGFGVGSSDYYLYAKDGSKLVLCVPCGVHSGFPEGARYCEARDVQLQGHKLIIAVLARN